MWWFVLAFFHPKWKNWVLIIFSPRIVNGFFCKGTQKYFPNSGFLVIDYGRK